MKAPAASSARFIWCDPHGRGRNVFAVFRRELTLAEIPPAALLHLFADSRYRLRVNGTVVGCGPARFVPACPEYDTHDVRPWLKPGLNTLTVEVNHFGACAFQAMPDDRGGFIAWGAVDDGGVRHDLATPGAWQVWHSDAWDTLAPTYSFAQPAAEIVDTRRWDGQTAGDGVSWLPPTLCADAAHWGAPVPRSIQPPLNDEQEAVRVDLAVSLAPEARFACRAYVGGLDRRQPNQPKWRFAVATCLHVDTAREAALGLFWGPFYLNGVEIHGEPDAVRGNRQNYAVRLCAGWNVLYGEVEVLQDVWGVLLALPPGVAAHVAPDAAAPCGWRCTAAMPEADLHACRVRPPAVPADLDAPGFVWACEPAGGQTGQPARECAWDLPAETMPAPHLPLRFDVATAHAVVLDFGGEFLGHPIIELDAPAGTVLDVVADEHKRPDGLLHLFATNPFTDTADRFVLHGGPQRIEGFHVRGGRYLQLVLRPSAGAAGCLRLRRVAVRRARTNLAESGQFTCDDALFNWVWRAGVDTLHACTEDAYLDCPWRERGLYGGDSFVIGQIQLLVSRDATLVRRCLRLFAQGRREDGLLPGAVPAWIRGALGDFTLIWLLSLHAYWRGTRDDAFVREMRPVADGIWRSTAWERHDSGLWHANQVKMFIDWGATGQARQGDENAALNVLRVAALRACAEMYDDASLAREADAVAGVLQQRLWRAGTGAFAPGSAGGRPVNEDGLHASILALAFGVEAPTQSGRLLAFVRQALRENFAAGVAGNRPYGHAELYFLHYALMALYRFDLAADAEAVVRTHYAPVRDAGAWTLWECFSRGLKSVGSLCHAWSGGPLVACVHDVVGIQPQPRGAAVDVLIAPCAETLNAAEATVPLPAGNLHVAWQVVGCELRVAVAAPTGLTWQVSPRGRLAALRQVGDRS